MLCGTLTCQAVCLTGFVDFLRENSEFQVSAFLLVSRIWWSSLARQAEPDLR